MDGMKTEFENSFELDIQVYDNTFTLSVRSFKTNFYAETCYFSGLWSLHFPRLANPSILISGLARRIRN